MDVRVDVEDTLRDVLIVGHKEEKDRRFGLGTERYTRPTGTDECAPDDEPLELKVGLNLMLVIKEPVEFNEIPISLPRARGAAARDSPRDGQAARKRFILIVVLEANMATKERVGHAA